MKLKDLEENQCFHFKNETKIRQVAAIIGDKLFCPIMGDIRGPLQFEIQGQNGYKIKDPKNITVLSTDQTLFTYKNVKGHIFQIAISDEHDVHDFFNQLNSKEDKFEFIPNDEFKIEEEEKAQYVVRSRDGSREIGILIYKEPGLT